MANIEQSYFARQRELVTLEFEEEKQAYSRSLAERGAALGAVLCEPSCRYPISIATTGNNPLGKPTLQLRYELAPDEVENEFEPGRPVTLFYIAPDGVHPLPHQCYVERAADGWMELSLPSRAATDSITGTAMHHLIGVQLGVDNTSFQVMLDALKEAERRTDEHFVHLRSVLLGLTPPSYRKLPRLSFPWLNESQQTAIQHVVEAGEIAIVHGPPGTGKTTTLIEAVVETLQRETQVLVCAPSNAAVDWISEQLSRRGINVLRVGNPLRMSDEMLDCSYERRYASHPDYHELWSIRRELPQASGERLHRLRSRQNELELRIATDIFNEARVVSCTLVGSSYRILDRKHFGTLFIDEAAQALEPACWAAIVKADRVVMGGDHQQLPPTVKSHAAHRELSQTLMEKVAKRWPQAVNLLDTQYRMHRDIMEFSSRWFYHSRLKAAPEAADRLITPLDTPLTWIDTSLIDHSERLARTGSRSNAPEARLVIHTLRDYIDMLTPHRVETDRIDFGIITPYRGQARLIRRLLKMQHYFRHLRRQITVGTVDGFQGRERDVILISLVRANSDGQIGFLRDLRRMNVAMTRARMKLIIVGNAETLAHHRFYSNLIDHIRDHGQFIQPQPNPEQQEIIE